MPTSKDFAEKSVPAFPPQSHTSISRKNVIAEQPAPAQNMSVVNPQHQREANEPAMRLRGGCIPCPVLMADAATSYRYPAVANSYLRETNSPPHI
ncbi:hypothetical protein BDZ97DRAFT_1918756 [Flammula alnicola]|nr:hypothetical protein BDZ97DRAFT_1918756 [Flammula alnicola]